MDEKDEKILALIEKLLEEKIGSLDARLTARLIHLTGLVEGNGKPGLLGRVTSLETTRTRLYAMLSVMTTFLIVFGMYIRGFVEDLYRHLYTK